MLNENVLYRGSVVKVKLRNEERFTCPYLYDTMSSSKMETVNFLILHNIFIVRMCP